MKKSVCLLLALLLVLGLCACGDGGEQTPTEPQSNAIVELPQEIWERPWVSAPDQGNQRVEVHPNGKCVIGNTERTYTVVHQSETEVVLDAEGVELHITLNPHGMSELHVGGNWEEHYVKYLEYWNIIYKAWSDENGECIEIFPAGISMSAGFFPEFRYDTANDTVEVMENGQVIYTIRNGYHEIWVTDVDGNETHYTRQIESGDTPVIPGPGMDEPLDEEERLNIAYNKALSDYNAAISGQPVYDEKGKEIADGPTLARYLYDQFLALGDYEDAGLYLHHFKSRTEVIKTEHLKTYSHLGELVYETTFDYDIPDYDIFGRLIERDNLLFAYGIHNGFQSNDRISLTRDENDVVTHVDIKINRFVEDGDGQHPLEGSITADLEYNEKGLLVASRVTEHHSDGYSNSYITTFAYDDHGRLSRVDVPNVAYGKYFADYTIMYLYDADGKLLQQMYVWIPVDQDLEFLTSGYPFEKLVITYHYNENGLLEKSMDYCYSYSGAGDGATEYTYDDDGRLIAESRYSVGSGFEDSGYSHAEWREKTEGLGKATFYPTATGDTVTYDDWLVNVLIDISAWDWIPYRYILNGEQFYSYSETTIMYIDLTPED